MLNTGVTTFEIAKLIIEAELRTTVITNSLKIVDLFAANNKTNILCLGGDLYTEGFGFRGRITNNNMNNVQGSTAFIGIHGLDIDEGMTLPWSHEAELVSIMIERCKKTVILADYIKLGRLSLYKIEHDLKDIDTIITDKKADNRYIEHFTKLGINIILAKT